MKAMMIVMIHWEMTRMTISTPTLRWKFFVKRVKASNQNLLLSDWSCPIYKQEAQK